MEARGAWYSTVHWVTKSQIQLSNKATTALFFYNMITCRAINAVCVLGEKNASIVKKKKKKTLEMLISKNVYNFCWP